MLDVLIDALAIGDPHSAGRGFGRYVAAMVDSLPSPELALSALAGPEAQLPDDVRRVPLRRRAWSPRVESRIGWEEHVARLAIDVHRAKPDVFLSPVTEPPLWSRTPWAHTLHDVVSLVYPHQGFARDRRRWRLRAPLIRRADAVIAISRSTADLGIKHLGLRPERVHVVYHGVTPVFRPALARTPPDRPFFLYVGAFTWHKGFREAFAAMEGLADAGVPHTLKVVGAVHDSARSSVEAFLSGCRHRDRIEMLGQVDDDELLRLYQDATALFVTSRHEGFGRPTIEAFACGTPVVSFDNTALPEIVGDAGLLAADGDVDAFVDQAKRLAFDPELRAELAERALIRAGVFDWSTCAAQHTEILRSIA